MGIKVKKKTVKKKAKKLKEFPCIEHTLEFSGMGGEFRVWIDTDAVITTPAKEAELQGLIDSINGILLWPGNVYSKHIAIAKLPNINAVQWRKKMGDTIIGTVIYTVGFEEDPHG